MKSLTGVQHKISSMSETANRRPSFDDSLNAILEHFNQLMTSNPAVGTASNRPSGAATLLHLISKELQTTTSINQSSSTPQASTPKSRSFPKLSDEPSYPAPINPNVNLIRHRSHGSFRTPPQIPPRRQRARSIAPAKSLGNTISQTRACGELLEPICAYTRKACRSQPGPDANDEENEIYLEWAELAVENCIRGAEEWNTDLKNEFLDKKNNENTESKEASSTNLLDVHRPKFGSPRPLTPYYSKDTSPPATPSLHDGFQDYCPPERHQRSPSTFVPILKPRTPRGPSVTSLVNSFNNLATTASQSGISKPNIVEEEPKESNQTTDEAGDSENPSSTPGLSGYLHKLMDNPTINYFKRMFHDEECKAPEPETKPEEQIVKDIPEHPAVALTRLEMSYVKDNFHNYIEAEPVTREELAASLRKSIS